MFSILALANDPPEKNPLPWQKPQPEPTRPQKAEIENPLANLPDDCAQLAHPHYTLLADNMTRMASNPKIVDELRKAGLTIGTVSWNDTGRSFGSSGGVNISDLSLVAITRDREGKAKPIAQPIVRLPNFEDKTVDVNMEEVLVPIGNAWGVSDLMAVPLRMILEDVSPFLSSGEKIKGSLYAPRDTQVLVSAQATILPVPQSGEAHFTPALYNYQSTPEHPALLVILVSNRGTSITIIDNQRDPVHGTYGRSAQMLFHNKNGEKSPFTAKSQKEMQTSVQGQQTIAQLQASGQAIAGQSGVNQMMMISVPLKYPKPTYRGFLGGGDGLECFAASCSLESFGGSRGLDDAVIDVADYTLGKFVELDGKGSALERDDTLPVRVDVMYYTVTDTVDLTQKEVALFPEKLRGVYESGKNLGSLVTESSYHRVTRNYQPWVQPWWNTIVVPYIPIIFRDAPSAYFETIYGPNWNVRFASESLAIQAVSSLKKQ